MARFINCRNSSSYFNTKHLILSEDILNSTIFGNNYNKSNDEPDIIKKYLIFPDIFTFYINNDYKSNNDIHVYIISTDDISTLDKEFIYNPNKTYLEKTEILEKLKFNDQNDHIQKKTENLSQNIIQILYDKDYYKDKNVIYVLDFPNISDGTIIIINNNNNNVPNYHKLYSILSDNIDELNLYIKKVEQFITDQFITKNILIPEVLQRYLYILQSYNNNLIVYVTSERINEFKNRDITTTTENDTSLIDIIYYLDHTTNNPDTNDKKEFAISNIKYLQRVISNYILLIYEYILNINNTFGNKQEMEQTVINGYQNSNKLNNLVLDTHTDGTLTTITSNSINFLNIDRNLNHFITTNENIPDISFDTTDPLANKIIFNKGSRFTVGSQNLDSIENFKVGSNNTLIESVGNNDFTTLIKEPVKDYLLLCNKENGSIITDSIKCNGINTDGYDFNCSWDNENNRCNRVYNNTDLGECKSNINTDTETNCSEHLTSTTCISNNCKWDNIKYYTNEECNFINLVYRNQS